MSSEWIVGQSARITVAITDAAEIAVDPGALRLKVKPPTGAALRTYDYGASAEIVKDADGQYHADIVLDAAGTWSWRWEGTAAPHVGVGEGMLTVIKGRLS